MKIHPLYLLLVIFSITNLTNAQSVIDKISRYEKAVFSISSYNKSGHLNFTASGFFISADGIAITPSKVFFNADSIAITLRNGRRYKIDRILSTHKMANLALIKIKDHRDKGFNYIIPSQNNEHNQSEVLIISHPSETEEGITLGTIAKVCQTPYLNRTVYINSNYDRMSCGSPVINNLGQLIGIAGFIRKSGTRYFLNTRTVNDSLWTNHPYNNWKKSVFEDHQADLIPDIHYGIINFANEEWVEAAKLFTLELKRNDKNIRAYILRSEARRQYENFIGMRSDLEKVTQLNPAHFLIDYYEAKALFAKQEKNNAFIKYISSIEKYDSYAPALVDFGLLATELRNDSETALKCFNKAIQIAPLYANGYYERSRLLRQFFNNPKLALDDINKAISLNNALPGSYSIRGTIKIQNEDYLEAISDLNKALEKSPHDTHALFNRGVAYYNLGMKKNSCKDWNEASQLGHFKSTKYISRYCNKIISAKTR